MSDGETGLFANTSPDADRAGGSAAAPDTAVSLGPLTGLAGFMLRLGQLRFFETFFAEFGDEGIRPGELSILAVVGENPGVRQGAVADALNIKWSNMAKIVKQLDEDGLIERRVPPSDRRAMELRLTSTGRDFVDRNLARLLVNDRATSSGLNAAEREELLRLLGKLAGHGPAGGKA